MFMYINKKLRITKGNNSHRNCPSSLLFIIIICPVDMNVYARFDEIPSITLKDIKKTKRYGRTDARTYLRLYSCWIFYMLKKYPIIQKEPNNTLNFYGLDRIFNVCSFP